MKTLSSFIVSSAILLGALQLPQSDTEQQSVPTIDASDDASVVMDHTNPWDQFPRVRTTDDTAEVPDPEHSEDLGNECELINGDASLPTVRGLATPSLHEISLAAGEGSRQAIESLLQPVLQRIGDLTNRTQALEASVSNLQGDAGALRSETVRTLAQHRAEIDALQAVVAKINAERHQRSADGSGTHQSAPPEKNSTLEKMQEDYEKLRFEFSRLNEKLATQAVSSHTVYRPVAVAEAYVAKNVTLPCGNVMYGVLVPANGGTLRCPKCGALSFVK